ncbi:hypothetical protein [Nostoc sp. 'Lobaria pulmonaria (5183) cyanobiont']|uniref:hypothetical protein n=1 Tax=Nostoc sp. 'Lobaria pulmonaria (5183) cyanobiont' TaxID=1618022 RepID=UPI000D0C1FD6|nr:hypothetical protein [Nostoc sp. 'Lobaria pulmonaria (5183) cyanobiont']AVH73829.1 hypothetical protein NLP_5531 [Nostoc sp. 'Lobaria pulmonaria (5183) cyanobiont']
MKRHNENKNYSTDGRGMGGLNAIGESYGLEGQRGTNTGNIQQGDTIGADVQYGDSSAGKLLGRLELLEKAFYGYVHGHQDRLKTRYKESTELESAFTEELQVIKQGLRELAQQVEDDVQE